MCVCVCALTDALNSDFRDLAMIIIPHYISCVCVVGGGMTTDPTHTSISMSSHQTK